MPQQFMSTQGGQVADKAHKIRLSLNVNSKRYPISGSNSSVYKLKEVSLLYEKEALPDYLLNSSLEGGYSTIQKSYCKSHRKRNDQNCDKQGMVSTRKFKGNAKDQSLVPIIAQNKKVKKDVMLGEAYFKTNQKTRKCVPVQTDLPLEQFPSQQKSNSTSTAGELFTHYRKLVLGKNQCRNSLEKRVDKYTRRNLETRYFAITEALVDCEEKIKSSGYGKYIPKLQQKILDNAATIGCVDDSVLSPASIPSQMGRMIMENTASQRSRLPYSQSELRTTAFHTAKSLNERDSIVFKANDLCKSYQNLTKIRLRLREKLESDINDKESRKKIESDYFKIQMKMDNILTKLKSLASNNGVDWRYLFDTTNLEIDLNDLRGLISNPAQSRSSSALGNQKEVQLDPIMPYVPHVTKGSLSDDYNYSLSEYIQNSSTEQDVIVKPSSGISIHDLNRLQPSSSSSTKKWYESRAKDIAETPPVLKSKGVQTEGLDIRDASKAYDINHNGKGIDDRKHIKTPLDENNNFISTPQIFSKPNGGLGGLRSQEHEGYCPEDIRRKRLEFFKKQGADRSSLLPKEDSIFAKEVHTQESMPETLTCEFAAMLSDDNLNYYQIHSEPPSDIAARLLLPRSPVESDTLESNLTMPEPRQNILERLFQEPKSCHVSEFSEKCSSDSSPSLELRESFERRGGSFYDGRDGNNMTYESDVDDNYLLFDASDFESTDDGSKHPESDNSREWSSADQIRERLLQASPDGSCKSSSVIESNAHVNEESRFRFVKSRIEDVRARLLDRKGPELLHSEKSIGINMAKSDEGSFELVKYRIDGIREKLQQREQKDDLEDREEALEDYNDSSKRTYISQIKNIRERLQQKNSIDVDCSDIKEDMDIADGSLWNPDFHENGCTDIDDLKLGSNRLINSMLNDLDRLENIQNGSQEERSISEVEYMQNCRHLEEFSSTAGNVPNGLDSRVDKFVNEDETDEIHQMPRTSTRMADKFSKTEGDTGYSIEATSTADRKNFNEELFEKRVYDEQEFDFRVFDNVENQSAIEHHSNQEIPDLDSFADSLRAHLGLNESQESYRMLSPDEENVYECATNTGSLKEDSMEIPSRYTSCDEEIITENFIEPVSRPPLSSIDRSLEESVEILDMLDEFESGIQTPDVHEEADQYVDDKTNLPSPNSEYTLDENICESMIDSAGIGTVADSPRVERKEEKCYDQMDATEIRTIDDNPEMSDADVCEEFQQENVSDSESDCSSSRSILRSPLTKGLELVYEGSEIEAETDVGDIAEGMDTDKELPRTDAEEVRMIAHLVVDPKVNLMLPGPEDTQHKDLDVEGVLLPKKEEYNAMAFSNNKILQTYGFEGQECAQTSEPSNAFNDAKSAFNDANNGGDIYVNEYIKGDSKIDINTFNHAKQINEDDLVNHRNNIQAEEDDSKIMNDDVISSSSNISSVDSEGHSFVVSKAENPAQSIFDTGMVESKEAKNVLRELKLNAGEEHKEDKDKPGNELLDIDYNLMSSTEEHLDSGENGASNPHNNNSVVQELKIATTSKESLYSPDIADWLQDTENSTTANAVADDLKHENDLFGDVLSMGSLDGSNEEEELEIVSSLCRENSFVNKAVIVELSHEDQECRGASVTLGNAGDLREEYRARADLQNLPDELLENLPLNFPPRFDLNSVTLQGPFIGETSGSDSQSEASLPDVDTSDSEEEIEFGPGSTHEDQNEHLIKDDQACKGFHDANHVNMIAVEFSNPFEKHIDSDPLDAQSIKCTDSMENKTELEKTSDEAAGTHFTNGWFERSQSELGFASRLDSSTFSGENQKNMLMAEINASPSELVKLHDAIVPRNESLPIDLKEGEALKEFASTGDGEHAEKSVHIEEASAENVHELGPSKENANDRRMIPNADSKIEDLRELAPTREEISVMQKIASEDSGLGNLRGIALTEFALTEEGARDTQNKESEESSSDDLREFEEMELLFKNEEMVADSSESVSHVENHKSCDFDGTIYAAESYLDIPVDEGKADSVVIKDFGEPGESSEQQVIGILDDILEEEEMAEELNIMEIDISTDDFADGDMARPLSTESRKDKIYYSKGQRSKGNNEVKGVDIEHKEAYKVSDNTSDLERSNLEITLEYVEASDSHHEKEPIDRSVNTTIVDRSISGGLELSGDEDGNEFAIIVHEESLVGNDSSNKTSVNEDIVCTQGKLKDTWNSENVTCIRIEEQTTSEEKILLTEGACQNAQHGHDDNSTRGDFKTTTASLTQAPRDAGVPVIVDNGSGRTKAGFSTSEYPTVVIPAIIGRPNYEQVMNDMNSKDYYVGENAQRYRGVLKLTYPLEHGVITDWDGMEKIWSHIFMDQLRIDPSEHPVLLTEAPFNPKKNRERMLEIMMETYQVPAFYVAIQAVLSLYVSGMTTGIVVDSGDGVTHVVPVYDGYSLPHATERMNIAGRDMTEYLMRILMERGYSFKTTAEREICREIKEKHCFVAANFEESLEKFERSPENTQNYMLPDGQMIAIGSEHFRCPEILFQPSLIGKDIPGIQDYLYKSVQRCDVDIRSELYSNIVLSGGTTMFQGMDIRLKNELQQLVPDSSANSIKIKGMKSREYSVWCGGAALANLPTFSQMWIDSEDYYESGVDIIHRKCF